MTLPKWNSAWENPDLLRGRRGWARHHYATVCVSVLLGVFVLGWAIMAFKQAHKQAQKLKQEREQRNNPFDLDDADPLLIP